MASLEEPNGTVLRQTTHVSSLPFAGIALILGCVDRSAHRAVGSTQAVEVASAERPAQADPLSSPSTPLTAPATSQPTAPAPSPVPSASAGRMGAGTAGLLPPVSLELSFVRFYPGQHHNFFNSEATLHNNTGTPIEIRTGLRSAFDRLSLVLRDSGGREVFRQGYYQHLSPYEPHIVLLSPGNTTEQLRLPLMTDLSFNRPLRARLEGELQGTAFQNLVSNEVPLQVAWDGKPARR